MSTVVTSENFDSEVIKSEIPVLVDFFAEWCGPCKMLAPIIDELAEEYKGKWKIVKLDIDASNEIAERYGVQSIPTLSFFKNGEVVDQAIGFQSKERLVEKLDKNL